MPTDDLSQNYGAGAGRVVTSRRLRAVMGRGAGLKEAEIREMWSLRLSVFSLKSMVDPEADWRVFRDELGRSTGALRVYSDDRILRGFWQQRDAIVHLRGRRVSVSVATYGFVDRAWRGHPVYTMGMTRLLAPLALRSLVMPVFGLGVGYPTTFMLLSRRGMAPIIDRHVAPDSLEATVLDAFRDDLVGPEGRDGSPLVDMPTLPESPPESWFARNAGHPDLARYLAINPDWASGHAVYAAVRVRPKFVVAGLATVARRALGRGRAGSK